MLLAISLASASFPPTTGWKPVLGSWDMPVLTADNATWEATTVCEPQVIWQPATKSLRMWYRGGGFGHPKAIGIADSTDGGRTWTRHPANPVFSGGPAGGPWVYVDRAGTYWMYMSDEDFGVPPRVVLATSDDGVAWKNASATSASVVPLPPNGSLWGNRAVWQDAQLGWVMLHEVMTLPHRVWEIFLYRGTGPLHWTVANDGRPLRQLQQHAGSMYGGMHIATVDGAFQPRGSDGLFHIWYHAGANGNLPTDIYYATSPDLLDWTTGSKPVISHQGAGTFAYDQTADPSPGTFGTTAFMAYDGDNNVAGSAAIGFAVADALPA